MLDAAACGIPIVANDTVDALQRFDGTETSYRLNDLDDLIRSLAKPQGS